eukprot:m.151751 g.151751  ORF g.151751 m.151751 type:complete len:140 (+) comp38582_c0_seq64:1606-2025(+)
MPRASPLITMQLIAWRILVLPSIVERPQEVKSLLGKSVEFRCTAFGFPVPEITWMQSGRVIVANSRVLIKTDGPKATLKITKLTFGDYGIYTCQAKNDGGKDVAEASLINSTAFQALRFYFSLTFLRRKMFYSFQQCSR